MDNQEENRAGSSINDLCENIIKDVKAEYPMVSDQGLIKICMQRYTAEKDARIKEMEEVLQVARRMSLITSVDANRRLREFITLSLLKT